MTLKNADVPIADLTTPTNQAQVYSADVPSVNLPLPPYRHVLTNTTP